jgi:hypothetical protein
MVVQLFVVEVAAVVLGEIPVILIPVVVVLAVVVQERECPVVADKLTVPLAQQIRAVEAALAQDRQPVRRVVLEL